MTKVSTFIFIMYLFNSYALEIGISSHEINKKTDLWDHPENCINRTELTQNFNSKNLIQKNVNKNNQSRLHYEFFSDFILNQDENRNNFIIQKIKKTSLTFNHKRELINEVAYLTESFKLTDQCGNKQSYRLDRHWGDFFFNDHLRIIIKEVETGFGTHPNGCGTEDSWSHCFPQNNIFWGGKYTKDPSLYNQMKLNNPVKWVFIFFLDNTQGKLKVDKIIYFK
ncbi:hypothetical protein N9N67_00800 [Bacteriovoracaceae bacterium]|nr:hypothetical protein [Bacteriovoracaceae bacterium]